MRPCGVAATVIAGPGGPARNKAAGRARGGPGPPRAPSL